MTSSLSHDRPARKRYFSLPQSGHESTNAHGHISSVWPVSTGNELTYHLLQVVYSADKVMMRQMEEKLDAELMAVDLNHIIYEYHSAINKKQ